MAISTGAEKASEKTQDKSPEEARYRSVISQHNEGHLK
jgi:hypothetical protein